MINEQIGTIIELKDSYGYILDNDNKKYLFLFSDFINYHIPKIGDKVIFKPIYLKNINLNKAILIEKNPK